jgi:protease I
MAAVKPRLTGKRIALLAV